MKTLIKRQTNYKDLFTQIYMNNLLVRNEIHPSYFLKSIDCLKRPYKTVPFGVYAYGGPGSGKTLLMDIFTL